MEKLQRWGVIAEIAAAIAVVLSIIYLGLGVRANTSAVQSQIGQGILELTNEANFQIAGDAQLADLFLRAEEDLDKITDADRLQFSRFISSELNIWEHAFYSYDNGTMNEKVWKAYNVSFRSIFCQESSNRIWREIERWFGAEFRVHVNKTSSEDCSESNS